MTSVDDAMHIHSSDSTERNRITQYHLCHCAAHNLFVPIYRWTKETQNVSHCSSEQKSHFRHSLVRTSRNLASAFFNDALRLNTHGQIVLHFKRFVSKANAFHSTFIDLNALGSGQVQHVAAVME